MSIEPVVSAKLKNALMATTSARNNIENALITAKNHTRLSVQMYFLHYSTVFFAF